MLNGKQRPEYKGKMLFGDNRFLGIITEAVESKGKIYCQYVYNDEEYDYRYIDDKPTNHPVICC